MVPPAQCGSEAGALRCACACVADFQPALLATRRRPLSQQDFSMVSLRGWQKGPEPQGSALKIPLQEHFKINKMNY